jgi:hypothetical protein
MSRIDELPDHDERIARIEAREEAEGISVCYYCEKQIMFGEARYTPVGAHWDCWRAKGGKTYDEADKEARAALGELKTLIGKLPPEFRR